MSDHSDDIAVGAAFYEAYLEELEELQEKIDKNAKKGFWKTGSGKKIKFCDLEPSHIKNIVKFFKNRHDDLIELPNEILKRYNNLI